MAPLRLSYCENKIQLFSLNSFYGRMGNLHRHSKAVQREKQKRALLDRGGLLHEYMGQIATKYVIFDGIWMGELSPPHSSTVEVVLYDRGIHTCPLCAAIA